MAHGANGRGRVAQVGALHLARQKPLTPEQKQDNTHLGGQRTLCENILGDIKRFAILRGPYHNHNPAKRFAVRFNLLAALHNQHL